MTLAFLLTGASGLIFETFAGRLLGLALGATADTAALALAAFMLAVTPGALAGGALARRVDPARAACLSQLALALLTLAVPAIARLVADVAIGAPDTAGVHAAAALVLVAPPAFLMGLFLPLVVEAAVRRGHARAPLLAQAYALSSAGGALGVIAAQIALTPLLGLAGTLTMGAALEAAAGLLVLLTLSGSQPPASSLQPPASSLQPPASSLQPPACLALAAGSAVLFALELTWLQILSFTAGATTTATGWMLVSVLAGLAIGGAHARQLDDVADAALPWIYVALAAVVGLTLPLWERAGPFLLWAGARVPHEVARLAFSALMLVAPAALAGTAFPLGLERIARAGGSVGQGAAAGAAGAALGGLLASGLLIPALGSERALRVLGGAALVVAALWARAVGRGAGLLLASSLAVAPLALFPAWNMDRVADGSALYFRRFQVGPVVWQAEDRIAGLVTVRGSAAQRALYTNGKIQGDTGALKDAQARMIAYPLLGLQRFERALVIGVGTGFTTHLVAAAPFRAVDAVEVSPAVLAAARAMFVDVNQGALAKVELADGRQRLKVAGPAYDLISIQVSSLWDSASTALYTREFYAHAAARLAPGGVLQQWLPLHHVTRRDLASLLATLQAELPHVTLWRHGSDGVALASRTPQPLVEAALRQRDADPRFAAFRAAAGRAEMRDLVGDLVLASPGVTRFAADGAVITDATNTLEWSAARALTDESLDAEVVAGWLEPFRTREFSDWR